MKFNKIHKLLEGEDIFKASTKKEGIKRRQKYIEIELDEMIQNEMAAKNEDGSYNIYDEFTCSDAELTELPVKFNEIRGFFDCSHNKLTTLKNSPTIVDGDFYCSYNQLTSLEGAPAYAGGDFVCGNNKKKFSIEDVHQMCDVRGTIYV